MHHVCSKAASMIRASKIQVVGHYQGAYYPSVQNATPVKTFEEMYLRGLKGSPFGSVNVYGSERRIEAVAGSINEIKVKRALS